MNKYKVISFDMFQTIVDVNERVPEIWKGILGDSYTKEKGETGARIVMSNLPAAYKKSVDPFLDMESMFRLCACNAVKEMEEKVAPEQIVHHLTNQHGYAPFYEDALATLAKLAEDYTVIISSDSSHLMIDPLLAARKVDRAFISDDLRCYKGDPSGKFFKSVLSELQIRPDEILHIGDSATDIVGARAAKIDSCLINRTCGEWKKAVKPDYEIHSLREVFSILE